MPEIPNTLKDFWQSLTPEGRRELTAARSRISQGAPTTVELLKASRNYSPQAQITHLEQSDRLLYPHRPEFPAHVIAATFRVCKDEKGGFTPNQKLNTFKKVIFPE